MGVLHLSMETVDTADLDRLLLMLAELDGSDLHIKAGAPPRMRLAGALRTMDDEPQFTQEETLAIAEAMMQPAILETFRERHEVDFAYSLVGTGRFRVNPTTSGARWLWPCAGSGPTPPPSRSWVCPRW